MGFGNIHTFSKHDLHLIFKHRRGYNRLGFTLQLALIRYPGWSLTEYVLFLCQ